MADDPEDTEDEDQPDDEDDASDDDGNSDDANASEDGGDSDDADAPNDDSDDSDDADADADDDDSDESDDADADADDSDDSDDADADDDDSDDSDDADGSGQQITKTDLDQGTDLPTGDQHDLQIPYEDVDVEIEWPSYIADRLPDDFALTLSGDDMDDQTVTSSGAEWTEEGAVRFAFNWRKKSRAVTLKATSGDQTVTLWDSQAAGDLETMIDWETQIDSLLVAEDDDDQTVDEDEDDGDTNEGEEDEEGDGDAQDQGGEVSDTRGPDPSDDEPIDLDA